MRYASIAVYTAMLLAVFLNVVSCWTETDSVTLGDYTGNCLYKNCIDMLQIQISRRDEGIFLPGTYEFHIEIDKNTSIVADCTITDNGAFQCESNMSDIETRLSPFLDTFIIQITNVSPQQILVHIYLDDMKIGEDILSPSYEYIAGNDPDCSDTCVNGTAEMRIL